MEKAEVSSFHLGLFTGALPVSSYVKDVHGSVPAVDRDRQLLILTLR